MENCEITGVGSIDTTFAVCHAVKDTTWEDMHATRVHGGGVEFRMGMPSFPQTTITELVGDRIETPEGDPIVDPKGLHCHNHGRPIPEDEAALLQSLAERKGGQVLIYREGPQGNISNIVILIPEAPIPRERCTCFGTEITDQLVPWFLED